MIPVLKRIGEILLIIVSIPMMLLLIVAASPVILWYILLDVLKKVFTRLRRDPSYKSPTKYLISTHDSYPRTERELKGYFNKYIRVIQKDCDLSSDIEMRIDNARDVDGMSNEPYSVTLSAVLAAKNGNGTASITMEAEGNPKDDLSFTSTNDGDRPPYLEVVYVQHDGLRTLFDVYDSETLEFLVASLNDGQCLSEAGQAWTKLTDGLFAVNYTVKKSEKSDRIGTAYGYRHEFSHKKVKEYFFDEKP